MDTLFNDFSKDYYKYQKLDELYYEARRMHVTLKGSDRYVSAIFIRNYEKDGFESVIPSLCRLDIMRGQVIHVQEVSLKGRPEYGAILKSQDIVCTDNLGHQYYFKIDEDQFEMHGKYFVNNDTLDEALKLILEHQLESSTSLTYSM